MGSYTENLDLYKVNTETDGNDTFNIETMMNENWDKIDTKIAEQEQKIEKAAYITHDNGINKYRFGVDDIGVYWEEVTEEGATT